MATGVQGVTFSRPELSKNSKFLKSRFVFLLRTVAELKMVENGGVPIKKKNRKFKKTSQKAKKIV